MTSPVIQSVEEAVSCNQEKKVMPPSSPSTLSNDLKVKEQCNEAKQEAVMVVVVPPPEAASGEAANQDAIDNKDSPSKSPLEKVDKTADKKLEEKTNQCSSESSAADAIMQPSTQPSSPRPEASSNAHGDNGHDTKDADNAQPTASPPCPKKEHENPPEELAKENSASAPKNDQVVVTVTKSPPPPTAPADNDNNNVTVGTKEGTETETPATKTANTKKNVDAIATTAQEQPCKDGNGQKTSSSPSKKKKSKKKKKKRKTSNPDTNPAQSKPAESPADQNQQTKSVTQDTVKDEKPDREPASGNNKKGAESSESKAVAPTTATDEPSKPIKAAAATPPKVKPPVVNEKGKGEKTSSSSSKSNGLAEKSPGKVSTDVPSKSGTVEVKKTNTKEKSDASPPESSSSSSSPNKKDAASQENQAKVEVLDDGAWETVEVKPRGRRGKNSQAGGGGNKKSSGTQNSKASSNNNTSNSSGNGRNHNNDHGSNHHDGGSSHHGRRRKGRNRDKRNNNSNGNNQQNNSSSNQQSKMIKDVISHILDAVDIEVARRAENCKVGNTKSLEDSKRNSRSNNNSDKRSSVASSNKNHGQQQHNSNEQRRKQSNAIVASSPPRPSPSLASEAAKKNLRDVLMGASAAALKNNIAKEQAKAGNTCGSTNNGSQSKAKGGDVNPTEPSKGPSKIKPGMSYKSVIEPLATSKPPPHPQQPRPQPKPKQNAWAKLPSESKPKGDAKKPGEKPFVQSSSSRLVPPDENKEKNIAANKDEDDDRASPPLSTLHAPGNSCSASSSVASSLEAPHSSAQFRHQSSSATACEDDVGYHLLNVCGQLSEDITSFMSRRTLALDIRRKERSAVLSAVGDTLGKIWPPGQCRVEMYGSCATQLDLPSSDLDLVVCGLDDIMVNQPLSSVDQQTMSSLHDASSNSFPKEEIPQECAPMSPPDHQLAESSGGGSVQQEGGGVEPSSPDQLAGGSVAEEGDRGAMLDESPDGTMLGMEYSPAASAVDNYSTAEYESNEQEAASEAGYSPGYSYHSQQDVVSTENYSQGYQGDDNMAMEGYGHEYQTNGQEYYYASPYNYVSSLSLNAQRVLRLASELELQPWAVQVKAIPTATVPVVKMLADPSKLPGLTNGTAAGTWLMQQHIAAAQAGVVAGAGTPISSEQISPQNQQGSVSSSSPHFFSPHPMSPQWRGADIMNGLQPVDITFEGLEHGGIGSTTFSAQVVQDACDETGLAPESTPVVQVASVLKELLAQRRLNEPFSGGLSSYGLLLLLLAVLKDRKIIQEEMQKIEKQRQKVSGEATSRSSLYSSDKSSASPPTASSSWASVAKKSNGSTARTDSLSTVTKSTNSSATTLTAKTGVNYSQVVQKESKEITKNNGQGKDQMSTKKKMAPNNGDSNARLLPETTERLSVERKQMLPQSSNVALTDGPAVLSQVTPSSEDDSNKLGSSSVLHGSNDVFEVLCSGELTSGKLLMHFLLFYGQHFDARSTLIDINGTHHPQYGIGNLDRLSPFARRPPGGSIDPVTGMFSVDQIVVYDPLEGSNDHNVSKRCYCWNNVKWVFAQCYMTVSSVVETSDTTCTTKSSSQSKHNRDVDDACKSSRGDGNSGNIESKEKPGSTTADEMTPILELLLSF
eukprot:CAMPEP_0172307422 /NCGR_PEP_ID=MMETSP1058-20130122/8291_1 /TAXON_ID=83371 /ORGANISM="Detonula confervacea, Strain CCMP 353" /LENGTH=1625 /DNA_ID=CAMNT_0013019589 /DNA_START=119 /DNA_END=4996 /DNA_ORIENTATION=-